MQPIYFDYNATTPCDPRVVEAMLPYFTEKFGNAASRHHWYGWQAEEAVKLSRERVAGLIGAEPNEIVFTSGATEACNLALKGITDLYAGHGNHIITTNIEHKAVLDTCAYLEKRGVDVTYLPVDAEGLVSAAQVREAITDKTVLVAVMAANNELGTLQPVKEIGDLAHEKGIIFFSDATQAVGKIPVDVNALQIDALALSAHKFYGPKGVGAIYLRRKHPRVKLTPLIHGGGHEKDIRSGTLNVPAIVGLGKAAEIARDEMAAEARKLEELRDRLQQKLLAIPGTRVNGSQAYRLPQTANISFEHVESEALLTAMKQEVALSSGSACTSATLEPSYVLKAIGLDDETAYSSLRFSLGRFTTADQVDFVAERVTFHVERLRHMHLL